MVENVLGQLQTFFTLGELRNLWLGGLVEGQSCGCGQPISTCPVWIDIIERAQELLPFRLDPRQVAAWQEDIFKWRNARRMLAQT
ncbi:MAG: hypothetical protein WD627_07735, partial [Actinomycetota bacterium]